MKQYDTVRVIIIRDRRFDKKAPTYCRNPEVGDLGTILEIYTTPEPAYEVECSYSSNGETIWLEVMFPEEIKFHQE